MAVTVTRPVPPLEGIGLGDKDNPISHLTGVGPTVVDEVAPQAALRMLTTRASAANAAGRRCA